MVDADFKTNMKEFREKIKEYGKRLDEEGIKRAAVDLSYRAQNAVKRDFTQYLNQGTGGGSPGKTTRTAHLRTSVQAVVKNATQFGLSTNVPYARVHELGIGPYMIYPKGTRLIGLAMASGNLGLLSGAKFGAKNQGFARVLAFQKGGKTIFASKVKHPGQKARHWMSIPMQQELTKYIDDQIKILEARL